MSSSNTATLRCDASNQAALRYIANQHVFQTWYSTVHGHELSGVSDLKEHVTVASFTSNAIQLYGHVVPGSNATFDLGACNMRWRDLYLTGNTIDLDGIRISKEGASLKVTGIDGNLVQILASNVSSGEVTSGGGYTSNAVLLNGQPDTFYTNASNVNAGTLAVAFGGTGSTNLTSSKLLVGNGSNAILTPSDLHWTGANLGIGSTTPFAKLDVSGTVRATSVTVTSTALASNLNADLLDGQQGSFYQNGNNINAGTVGVAYGGTGATTLAANKLMVGNGTGTVLTPTNLHWDNTNARLGLGGVTAPDTSLHTKGVMKVESGGGNATAPKLYFISEYESSAGQYWWKLANITLQNGNLFEVDGNFSRVDGATGYFLSVLGTNNNTNSNVQIYCEVTRPSSIIQSAFEIYRDTSVSPNKADIYIRTVDYVWASMRVQTHGTVYPVSWGNTAPVTSASYYKIFDSGFASNCTLVKTQNRQIGIGIQPRSGYSIDVEGNIAGAGFFGNGGGLTSINIGNVGIGTLAVANGGTGTSTLAANKILVGNGTSAITSPSDLHWSGANLGIGTTSPVTKLDVSGTMQATAINVTSTGLASNLNADLLDGQQGSYYQNATNINAGTLGVAYGGTGSTNLTTSKLLVGNGTSAITSPSDLHWSGANLGIGSTAPATKLDVIGTVQATALIVMSTGLASNLNADLLDGQQGSYYQNATNINTGVLGVAYGGTGSTSLSSGKLLVGNGTSAITSPSDLHWNGANLGIGSTTPASKLDVTGTVQATALIVTSTGLASNLNADLLDGQQGSFYQNATNINTGVLGVAYGGTGSTSLSSSKLLVGNGTSAITSPSDLHWSGANLGIGTTIPVSKLDVAGTIRATSVVVSSTELASNLNADLLDGQQGLYYQNATNINAGTLGVAYGGTGAASLTASKILVGNGTSPVLAPTTLHWNTSTGNLGINVTTPSEKLHVYGGSIVESTSANPFKVVSANNSSSGPYIYVLNKRSDANPGYSFAGRVALAKNRTNGVLNTGSTTGMIAFGGNHTDTSESNIAFSAAIVGISESDFTDINTMNMGLAFYTGTVGKAMDTANAVVGAERMRVTSLGNIGIGTVTPVAKLDVSGSVQATSVIVTSTALASNLNADLLDGQQGSYYQNAANINAGVLGVTYGGIGTSSLTSSKLLVGNGASALSSPSDLHWTGANLGIGSTTPVTKLDVAGTVQATSVVVTSMGLASNLNADLLDGQQGSFYQDATNINAGTLGVGRGGTGANTLSANKLMVGNGTSAISTPTDLHWSGANLGIGSTNPVTKLDVSGTVQATAIAVTSTGLVTNLNADLLDGQHGSYYQNATNVNAGTLGVTYGGTGSTNLTASKLLVGNGTSAVSAPTDLHWSGSNLGIGTTNPVTKLDVAGTIRSTSIIVSSTALSSNLNSDLLDGQEGIYYKNANNINAGTLGVAYGGTGANTLTTSKLLVGNGTNVISTPTDLHWSGANLGIGSTNPVTKLDVVGTIQATSVVVTSAGLTSNLNADLLDGQHGSYYQNATNINAGVLGVTYGGTGATTLTSSKLLVGNGTSAVSAAADLHWSGANLGIGSTNPVTKLDVAGTIQASAIVVSTSNIASNLNADLLDGQHGSYYQNATNINSGTLGVAYGGTGSATLTSSKLLVGNGTSVINAPSDLHWSGANLGIGSTNPVTKLDVVGTIQASKGITVNGTANIKNLVALNQRAPLATVNRVVSTWTARAGIVSDTWHALCWSPEVSLFVAVGEGTSNVMTSTNGIAWTSRTAAAANAWRDVCWSPERSLFVAVAASGVGNRVMTSPDGVTWTSRTSAADKEWRSVTWSAELSLFVSVAYDYNPSYVMKSTDGITWTLAATVPNGYWTDVCWSPDLSLFVAVNGGIVLSNQAMTSPDGITWIGHNAPDSSIEAVCWSPELSLFVAVCSIGRVITSSNGIDWTERTAAASIGWKDVCWSPELSVFVAVGTFNAITTHVMTSRDGINWTARTTPGNMDFTGISWSPQLSMFVGLVGVDSGFGIIITSEVGLPNARSTLLVNPSHLTATSAGRIGINQTSPSYTLHVNGSVGCGNIDMPSSTLTATGGSVIANILRPKGPFYGGTSAFISHNDNVGSDLRIEFVVGGTPYAQAYGYITNAGLGTKQLNFTGQHKVFHTFTGSNLGSYSGLIVSSTGHYRLLDHTTRPTINEALPVVKLANTPYDPSSFGVVSGIEDKDSYEFSTGHFVSVVEKQDSTDIPLIVNAVGEGSIWVCDINGQVTNGDYLTTSSVPGYAMRQGSDANKSYTVAKCTCDCDFDDTMVPVREIKMKTITYEEEDFVYEDVSTEQEQTYFDEALQKLIRKKFVTVKKQYVTEPTPVYDEQLNVVSIQDVPVKRVCTKTKKVADLGEDGELQFADVLDANGNVRIAPRYDIRYLDQDGRLIDKATHNHRKSNGLPAYKAAFVGCVYSFV